MRSPPHYWFTNNCWVSVMETTLVHVLNIRPKRNCKSHLAWRKCCFQVHFLTTLCCKIRSNVRNTHELPSFFLQSLSTSSRYEMSRGVKVGQEYGCRVKCRTARSSIRKCLDHMSWKPSTQTLMFPGHGIPLCVSEDVKMLFHWHLEKSD